MTRRSLSSLSVCFAFCLACSPSPDAPDGSGRADGGPPDAPTARADAGADAPGPDTGPSGLACAECRAANYDGAACATERAACMADAGCASYLSCADACTTADCLAACRAMIDVDLTNTTSWPTAQSLVLAVAATELCSCEGCSACTSECDLASEVASSANLPQCSECYTPGYDPACGGRLCRDSFGDGDLRCVVPCTSDADCGGMLDRFGYNHPTTCQVYSDVPTGVCIPADHDGVLARPTCTADHRAFITVDDCGGIESRLDCGPGTECDPTVRGCSPTAAYATCEICTADTECTSHHCADTATDSYCTNACTDTSSCGIGFTCMFGQCVADETRRCSSDRHSVEVRNTCGIVTMRIDCDATSLCRVNSRGYAMCQAACYGLDTHGSVSCAYPSYDAATETCCGSCFYYDCPDCGLIPDCQPAPY